MDITEPMHIKLESLYSQVSRNARNLGNLRALRKEEIEIISRIELKSVDYELKVSKVNNIYPNICHLDYKHT